MRRSRQDSSKMGNWSGMEMRAATCANPTVRAGSTTQHMNLLTYNAKHLLHTPY